MPTTKPALIFGDAHGHADKLGFLLKQARSLFGPGLDIYSVGDLIDRGPDSKGVVQLCIDNGVKGIFGNHELWLHWLLKTGEFDRGVLHPIMGGTATLDSYGIYNVEQRVNVPSDHKDYILGLPLYRRIEVAGVTYWLTHAGVSQSMADQMFAQIDESAAAENLKINDRDTLLMEVLCAVMPSSILWDHFDPVQPNRYHFRNGGVQVFGHTGVQEVMDTPTFIALDTGCGRKQGTPSRPNHLSGVVLLPEGGRKIIRSA